MISRWFIYHDALSRVEDRGAAMESVYDPRRSKVPINSARFKDVRLRGTRRFQQCRFASRQVERRSSPAALIDIWRRRIGERLAEYSLSITFSSRTLFPLIAARIIAWDWCETLAFTRPILRSLPSTFRGRLLPLVAARCKPSWKDFWKIKRHVSRHRCQFPSFYLRTSQRFYVP